MTVPVAQMRISRDMTEAERALDEALIRHSSLFTTMVSARRETASGPAVGHEALLRLARSQQALLEAGADLHAREESGVTAAELATAGGREWLGEKLAERAAGRRVR